jgi:acyl-CoA thioesterase-2
MNTAIDNLLQILDLEPLEHNLFRGRSPQAGWQRVFGGQVIGQALVAASRTVVEDRHVHSLHGYFLRPGDPSVPIIYEVDRIRDGGSFTTRRVVAIQHGNAIFSMSASFQVHEDGMEYQAEMPDVPMPNDLPSEQELKEKFLAFAPENVKSYWERERPIELRPVDMTHYFSKKPLPAEQYVWVRASGPLPDDERIHHCVLAYASDMTLLDTSLFPHGTSVFSPKIQAASLDHAMWFHHPFRADEWLLYATDSTRTSGSRGMNRGLIYTQDGKLIASTAQEGLIRLRTKESGT